MVAVQPPVPVDPAQMPEDALKTHQRYCQFMKYQLKNPGSKKHGLCQQLAGLYDKCQSAEERKQFVQRWARNGGSKGDLKVLIKQEITLCKESWSLKEEGMMTPGQIATLIGLSRERCSSEDAFKAALEADINANQTKFGIDPAQGKELGIDFWTTRFAYTLQGEHY